MPQLPTVTILLAIAPALAQSQDLDGAAAALQDRMESTVIDGAKQCVAANNVAAAELLLGVMEREQQLTRNHLTAAHYRDVTFEFVTRLVDPYARRRVAHDMRTNKKHPFARQWAAEAVGFYDEGYGAELVKALGDRFVGVRRWAAWSLGKVGYEQAADKLQRLVRDKDEILRANAAIALARIDRRYAPQLATGARSDKDAGVRAALLAAAPEVCGDDAEQLASDALADADWRPRAQAVDNLSATRTKTAVDALIRALGDGRPAISERALGALQQLTGQPITQKQVWPKWWADNRVTFSFPETSKANGATKQEPHTIAFEGIPLTSDNVAFVLDKSIWMKKSLTSSGDNETRNEAALDELKTVIEKLTDSDARFNIFVYDEEIEQLAKKSSRLTKKSAKRALKFAAVEAGGKGKDQWQILEHLMTYPEIDTVYFISSGEADRGLYVHGNRIGRHLRDLNRFYKKTIHAIAYSEKGYHHHVRAISEATGGTFKGIE